MIQNGRALFREKVIQTSRATYMEAQWLSSENLVTFLDSLVCPENRVQGGEYGGMKTGKR